MSDDDRVPDVGKIRFWHLSLLAAVILGFTGLVVGAGAFDLFGANPERPPDRGHDAAPLPTSSNFSVKPGALEVRVNGGPVEIWAEKGARLESGVFVLPWSGENHTLTIRFRADNPAPQRLAYDATLARKNTFNATWDGRAVAPSDASYFDYLSQEVIERNVAGRVFLEFPNATVEGKFPYFVKGFNYRGALSFAFFGGAAVVAAVGWWRKRRT